jgi:hypothetical protein
VSSLEGGFWTEAFADELADPAGGAGDTFPAAGTPVSAVAFTSTPVASPGPSTSGTERPSTGVPAPPRGGASSGTTATGPQGSSADPVTPADGCGEAPRSCGGAEDVVTVATGRPGRFGQSRKCSRTSPARRSWPHPHPQGIAGPGGRPAPGAFFRFGCARWSAIKVLTRCVNSVLSIEDGSIVRLK